MKRLAASDVRFVELSIMNAENAGPSFARTPSVMIALSYIWLQYVETIVGKSMRFHTNLRREGLSAT